MLLPNISQYESKRLHYGKYLHKLVLSNTLNHYFRTELQKHETLSHVREKLDELTELYRKNEPLVRPIFRSEVLVPTDDYFDALDLYALLKNNVDYKIRVEQYHRLTVYSNNYNLLVKIANKLRNKKSMEFHTPSPNNVSALLENEKIIIVDTPPQFNLKVHFNNKKVDRSFAVWCKNNTDKCKIGKVALESVESYGYLNNYYMYIRDEKVLNLILLLIGNNIRSVEKLVYKDDIDK